MGKRPKRSHFKSGGVPSKVTRPASISGGFKAPVVSGGRPKVSDLKSKAVSAARSLANIATGGAVGRRVAATALVGGTAAALAFGGEQLAEKLGVRGGAGFVGRRPPAMRMDRFGRLVRRRSKSLLNKRAMKTLRRAAGLRKSIKKAAKLAGFSVAAKSRSRSPSRMMMGF